MTGTIEWGCNWYEQGMELIDEHLFWGMLTMTIGEAWAIPIQSQQFPPLHGSRRFTTALPAEVGIAHEDIAALQTAALRRQRGRLRVRRWARPKWWGDMRRLARIKRMWHVIRWSPPSQWCHPSLDLGRTASISPFRQKYVVTGPTIESWTLISSFGTSKKKQSPMNSHSWTPMVGHKDLRIQPKKIIYQWCVYRCLHDSGAPHRFFLCLFGCLFASFCLHVCCLCTHWYESMRFACSPDHSFLISACLSAKMLRPACFFLISPVLVPRETASEDKSSHETHPSFVVVPIAPSN